MRLFNRKSRPATPENMPATMPATLSPLTVQHGSAHHGNDIAKSADLPDYERNLLKHLLSGVDVLEEVRNTLLVSSEKLRQEQQILEELNNKNDAARKHMQQLEQQISQISGNAQQELQEIGQFRESLADIHQCVAGINRISQQTDLLAINSAIEAAHVGANGRGFTVIAKEITTLSAEVQRQSAKIVALTESISAQAQQLCQGITEQVPLVQQMQQDIHETGMLLNEVIQQSARMLSIIRLIAIQQFLNTIKMDHIIWKYQVYRYLLDRNQEAKVNTHTECRFGKWYYGAEGRQYAVYPAFADIEQHHVMVHSAGGKALSAFFCQDQLNMERELEHMERASHQVVLLLDKLMEQIRQ